MSKLPLISALVAAVLLVHPAEADEVTNCTEITSVPFTISASGIYCLKQNLVNTTVPTPPPYLPGAIKIEAHNVTIDLNGFTLSNDVAGPDNDMNGIVGMGAKDVTIRNGRIEGFRTGVLLGSFLTERSTVENIRVNGGNYRGILVVGPDSLIRGNHVTNIGPGTHEEATGITLLYGQNSVVKDNIVSSIRNPDGVSGIGFAMSPSVSVRGNTIFNLRDATRINGIAFVGTTRAEISDNHLLNNEAANAGIANLGFSSNIACINNTISGFTPTTGGCDTAVGNTDF